MIRGPIAGGKHGWAFGRPLFDLAARGYVEEEFFLAGDATTYRPVEGAEWGRDGRWRAEPKGTMPFETRLLVYRPADPQRFNGTVVVCWNNVTAGYELFHGESPEILEGGYAYVGATVQHVGVHGFPATPQGLAAWDPERYGELSIPADEGSYDIYAQVGRVGRTSMTLHLQAWAQRYLTDIMEKVTEADFVMVRLDENGKPAPIPPA